MSEAKTYSDFHVIAKIGNTLTAGDNTLDVKLDFIGSDELWHLVACAVVCTTLTRPAIGTIGLIHPSALSICTPLEGPLWRVNRGVNWNGRIPVTHDMTARVRVLNATASDVAEYYLVFERAYK